MRTRSSCGAADGDELTAESACIKELAQLLREARHCVFCTGAGISTNAGLRDYRGPEGIWTEAVAKGLVSGQPGEKGAEAPWDEALAARMEVATPTLTHRCITALATLPAPLVRFVVSQNEDGLHVRAGLPRGVLSEIHGNAFIELCSRAEGASSSDSSSDSDSDSSSSESDGEVERRAARRVEIDEAAAQRPAGCGLEVTRRFVTYRGDTYKRSNPMGRHVTGRACPRCRPGAAAADPWRAANGPGWLVDSTVDFGELPGGHPWGANAVHNYAEAQRHMRHTDLVVVWGSELSILANYFDPWNPRSRWAKPPPVGVRQAPPRTQKKGAGTIRATSKCRLVIINKGKAHDDARATLKIEHDVDAVAKALCDLLRVDCPPYDAAADPLARAAENP